MSIYDLQMRIRDQLGQRVLVAIDEMNIGNYRVRAELPTPIRRAVWVVGYIRFEQVCDRDYMHEFVDRLAERVRQTAEDGLNAIVGCPTHQQRRDREREVRRGAIRRELDFRRSRRYDWRPPIVQPVIAPESFLTINTGW